MDKARLGAALRNRQVLIILGSLVGALVLVAVILFATLGGDGTIGPTPSPTGTGEPSGTGQPTTTGTPSVTGTPTPTPTGTRTSGLPTQSTLPLPPGASESPIVPPPRD